MTGDSNRSPVELILELDVAPEFEEDVDSELIKDALSRALATTNVTGPVTLSLVVTRDSEVRELNLKYRGIDAPTDVLSFSQLKSAAGFDSDEFPLPSLVARPLGDVIISGDRVRSQSAEYGHAQRRELAYLAVHGLLHVLGHDHETPEERRTMREAEERALARVPR